MPLFWEAFKAKKLGVECHWSDVQLITFVKSIPGAVFTKQLLQILSFVRNFFSLFFRCVLLGKSSFLCKLGQIGLFGIHSGRIKSWSSPKTCEITVNVRKPDVRFSAFSKVVQFPNVRISNVRFRTGSYRPKLVPIVRIDQNRFQTGFRRFNCPNVRNPDNIVRLSDV